MGPQKQKTSKPRSRIEDSENQMQIPEPPKGNANKVRFQKSKIALEDLTNKSVTTPMKSMGNATDKEGDPSCDEQQSINKSSGRQTRGKGKSILSSNPIDNRKRQTNSKHNNLSKTLARTENPVDIPGDVDTINVGTNLSNGMKCSRQTRKTAKESSSSSMHSVTADDFTTTNGITIGKTLQVILTKLPDIEAVDDLEESKNSTVVSEQTLPTGIPGFSSKPKMVEGTHHLRQTRNMAKIQNMSTLNKPGEPKEMFSKSLLKDTKPGSRKKVLSPIESQVIKSPMIKNSKSPLSKKKGITTAPKAKRKTAVEKWIEQAAEVSLVDSSSSGTCRKSARLCISKLSTTSQESSKNDSTVIPPRSATKRTLVAKRVPVWKTEPKPELLHSAPDDVYGFEYDASECKPAKKKRTRKPKKEDDDFKASKIIVAPKQTKRLPRTLIRAPREDEEESAMRTKIGTKPLKVDKNAEDTTPLLIAVAEKLKKMTDHVIDEEQKEEGLDDISHIHPIADESINVYNITLPENDDAEHEIELDEKNKSKESGVLAGDLEDTGQVIPSHISQAEIDMENLFGFEDPGNDPPASTNDKSIKKQLVKSTPIKQTIVAECFASVSPVRKVAKATRKSVNRPARIDENVARDLIRGIRPLRPAMDKQKPTSLMQYIKDVAEEDPDENSDSTINAPPTPPTVFLKPPRRSYSKRELRTVKRTILQDDDDKEFDPSDEEETAPKKSKKCVGGKIVHKKNKRDEEEEQWCKVMNSHFEDVEKFNLSS